VIEQWKYNNIRTEELSPFFIWKIHPIGFVLDVIVLLYITLILPAWFLATGDALFGSKSVLSIVEGWKLYVKNVIKSLLIGFAIILMFVLVVSPVAWWGNTIAPEGSGVVFFSSLLIVIFGIFLWLLVILPAFLYVPWAIYKNIGN
jgi:hypothetical protein